MLVWFCVLAVAGVADLEAIDEPVGEWVRGHGAGDVSEARKVARRLSRRRSRTPSQSMELADALRVQRDHEFAALSRRLDAGEEVDFSPLEAVDRRCRDLYLDATPGLPDDLAARALFLAAEIGEDLGLDPTPELETALDLDPTGVFAASARLKIAEAAYESGDMIMAIMGYNRVIRDGGRLAPYAKYKRSWCRYLLGRVPEAIEGLVDLAGGEDELAGEARRDAVLFAGRLPRPEALLVVERVCDGDEQCVEAGEKRLRELSNR